MEEDGAAATTEKFKVEVVPRHVFAPKIQRVARGPCRLNLWEWLILTPSRPMHMIRVVQKPTCMNEASQNAKLEEVEMPMIFWEGGEATCLANGAEYWGVR